jgi:hypothetical protein
VFKAEEKITTLGKLKDAKLSAPKVFKPTNDTTPPDKSYLQLDFRSKVTKNSNDARSDY